MSSSQPPASLPEGVTEADYEAIEAAVTETVRGRWFLAEFARRNRIAETRQLLDAVGRIELAITAGQAQLPTPPSADPSIRLLIQRIKEIAGHLHGTAEDMRESGVERDFVEAVEHHARAVAGLMRNATPSPPRDTTSAPTPLARPSAPPPAAQDVPKEPGVAETPVPVSAEDPRLAALSGLDRLSFTDKLALFG